MTIKTKDTISIALIAISFCILLCHAESVSACECIKPLSPADELKRATAVFFGEVQSTTTNGEGVSVEFNIERVWKGEAQKQITVLTSRYGSDCGIEFRPGVKYIVYAFGKDLLTVSRCTRTKELGKAKHDLVELGEGKKP